MAGIKMRMIGIGWFNLMWDGMGTQPIINRLLCKGEAFMPIESYTSHSAHRLLCSVRENSCKNENL